MTAHKKMQTQAMQNIIVAMKQKEEKEAKQPYTDMGYWNCDYFFEKDFNMSISFQDKASVDRIDQLLAINYPRMSFLLINQLQYDMYNPYNERSQLFEWFSMHWHTILEENGISLSQVEELIRNKEKVELPLVTIGSANHFAFEKAIDIKNRQEEIV